MQPHAATILLLKRLSRIRHATWRLSRPAEAGRGLLAEIRARLTKFRSKLVQAARTGATALGLAGKLTRVRAFVAGILAVLVPGPVRTVARRIARFMRELPRLAGLPRAWRFVTGLPSRIMNKFYSFLYHVVQRQGELVRRFAKPLSDPTWRLVTSAWVVRYLRLAARLERRRPRLIARLMFRVAQYVHITVLGIQLASGHSDRALKLARMLNLLFRYVVTERRKPGCHMYFEALFRTMRFDRIVREVPGVEEIDDHYLNHEVAVAHLYVLDARRSIAFMQRAIAINSGSYIDHRMLGRACIVKGDLEGAKAAYKRSTELLPITVMAHQNYAGRYDVHNYKPKPFELEAAGELLVYDNLGQFAEDLFLQGRFHESFHYYQQMLDYQRTLARNFELPAALASRIAEAHPAYDKAKPTRLLPYEWVIQFGHIGLLDIYMKMAKLGMYPDANYVVLAPKHKVANEEFLRYWDRYYSIVRDPDLVDELFPYQRFIGENFMAYPSDTGEAEPWTRAGARAQVLWAEQGRGPLLELTAEDREFGEARLAELGVPKGAWYVGLHVREGGFYGEASSGISTHRNASIDDYMPAVQEIIRRGGWVVRLGDKSMRPLAPMAQVVDYAVSRQKSATMDLFLLATSRFVIGTTSGLTTACLSFGRPMVLVNAISNDWQLWTDDTDFIVKRLKDRRTGKLLSFGETYRQPIQGYLINNVVTNRRGYSIVPNTADEITEAVCYKLDILDGRIRRPDRSHPAVAAYRREMSENACMFGAAHPVVPFLARPGTLSKPPKPTNQTGTLDKSCTMFSAAHNF